MPSDGNGTAVTPISLRRRTRLDDSPSESPSQDCRPPRASSAAFAAVVAGCERPTAATTGRADAKAARPVGAGRDRPARRGRRSAGSSRSRGRSRRSRSTAIHAKIAGFVRSWSVNIGVEGHEGAGARRCSTSPRSRPTPSRSGRWSSRPRPSRDQAEAAVEGRRGRRRQRRGQGRRGPRRHQAERGGPRALAGRVPPRRAAVPRAGPDRKPARRDPEQAARPPRRPARRSTAQVKTAEAALAQSRAGLDKAHADLAAAEVRHRGRPRRGPTRRGPARVCQDRGALRRRRDPPQRRHRRPDRPGPPGRAALRRRPGGHRDRRGRRCPSSSPPPSTPATPRSIRLQAIPGRTIEGKVTRTAYALDPKSRTLRAEIDLPNPDGKLHPGLYAYATIVVDEQRDALTLPTTAIGRDGTKSFCVAVRGRRAMRVPIEVGIGDGTREPRSSRA